MDPIKEEKAIERFTPVRLIIIGIIVALLAFVVLDTLKRHEGAWFSSEPKKNFSGSDMDLIRRAVATNDTEYCNHTVSDIQKMNCERLVNLPPRQSNPYAEVIMQALKTHNSALCDTIPIDQFQYTNCKRIVEGGGLR